MFEIHDIYNTVNRTYSIKLANCTSAKVLKVTAGNGNVDLLCILSDWGSRLYFLEGLFIKKLYFLSKAEMFGE